MTPTDPQSWNGYSYVGNNPSARVDPNGKGAFWEKFKNAVLWGCRCTNAEIEKRRKADEDRRRQEIRDYSQTQGLNGYIIVSGSEGPQAVTVDSLNSSQVLQISQTIRYLQAGINVAGVGTISRDDALNLISLASGAFFRGGSSLEPRSIDVKVDKTTGLVQPGRGVSVSTEPTGLERFGGAYKIESVPPELEVIQRGANPNHFEIAPRQAMTLSRYQELLKQVKLVPVP